MRSLGYWGLKKFHERWIGLAAAETRMGRVILRSPKTESPGMSVPSRNWSSPLLFTLKSNKGYKSVLWALISKVKVTDHMLWKQCPSSWTIAHSHTCIVIYFKINFSVQMLLLRQVLASPRGCTSSKQCDDCTGVIAPSGAALRGSIKRFFLTSERII